MHKNVKRKLPSESRNKFHPHVSFLSFYRKYGPQSSFSTFRGPLLYSSLLGDYDYQTWTAYTPLRENVGSYISQGDSDVIGT